jgi:quinol-cytochrome oxidoreductase complex cytochrome b subunit
VKGKAEQGVENESGGVVRRFLRSIVGRPLLPSDDKDRRWLVLNLLLLHLRPVNVVEKTLRHRHTWGLGGSGLVLIALLMATGSLMMFVYEPSPENAYESVLSLQNEIAFGALVRGLHHWSANLLVVVVLLHMLRVFLTGGFLGPRQFNWVIGLILFALVFGANFTGYLLPWDQLSYWAITISTGMLGYVPFAGEELVGLVRGGDSIGPATLITFYTLHTTVIPVALIVLMAFHFWRVRKAGGVVVPRVEGEQVEEKPQKVLFLPNLFVREVAQACVLVASVMVMALLIEVPLEAAANPGMSPNPAKAPWYFAGFQELLLHLPPLMAVVILPGLAAFCLVALPYLPFGDDTAGVCFRSKNGRRCVLFAAAAALVFTPVWLLLDQYAGGVWLPPTTFVVGILLFLLLLRVRFLASGEEIVQACFVFALVGFVVLTLTCVWLRGPGMALTWPSLE